MCEGEQAARPAYDVASRELPRHEARTRALEMLYEREIKDISCSELLGSLAMPADTFALMVVQGVCNNIVSIDNMLDEASAGWPVDRMPVVDRLILRMATYELMALAEIPLAVVLDEAVELANEYSTEDSGRFVNGVLANISATVRHGS
ncbi:MAG: transcription antitermination factor NusB [Acidimicrobiales bacterium]